MIRIFFVLAGILSLLLATAAFAQAYPPGFQHGGKRSTQEAWVSASSFDGRSFIYQVTAYDTDEVVQIRPAIACEFTSYGAEAFLKAVEVRLFLESATARVGHNAVRTGAVDIQAAIKGCETGLRGGKNPQVSPVEIRLPRISVSSQI